MKKMAPLYLLCILMYYLFICLFQSSRVGKSLFLVAILLHGAFTIAVLLAPRRVKRFVAGSLLVFFGTEIMLFSLLNDILVLPNEVAILYPFVLILMTQIYTLSPRKIIPVLTMGALLYGFLSYNVKTLRIFAIDMLCITVAFVIGMVGYVTMMIYKLEAFRAESKLQNQTFCDALTGVMSRHAFSAIIQKSSDSEPVSTGVIFLDINALKQVNDTLGHQKGDEYICRVAMVLQRYFAKESIFRISGDEFVVLKQNISYISFESAVECLNSDDDICMRKMASVGMAWQSKTNDIATLVNSAEKNMYANKRGFYLDMMKVLNVDAFSLQANALLENTERLSTFKAIVMVDIDSCRQINEVFGRTFGDRVIEDVAGVLRTVMQKDDIIGRMYNDEFIVLFNSIQSKGQLDAMLEKVRLQLYRELPTGLVMSCSIGVGFSSAKNDTAEMLLNRAKVAAAEASDRGGNMVVCFTGNHAD